MKNAKPADLQKKSSFKNFLKRLFLTNIELKIGAIAAAVMFWLLAGFLFPI